MPDIDLTVFARTDGTNAKGERDSKWGDPQYATASPGYVLNEKHLRTEGEGWKITEQRGDENYPAFEFSDYVPIRDDIPELKAPRKMKVTAHARSPKGYGSGSGMTKILVQSNYIKL